MELNYQDHEIIKNYINLYLNNKENFIELLFNPYKCNHLDINNNNINNFEEQFENIKILLNYLIEKNFITNHWKISSLKFNQIIKLFDLFYNYFIQIKRPGILMIVNDLSFCNNEIEKLQIENYIQKFLNIQVKILFTYQISLNTEKNNLNNIFNFLSKYDSIINLIIDNNLQNCIENIKEWEKIFEEYNINTFPNNNLDKTIKYNDDFEKQLKKLIKYRIQKRYALFEYDIKLLTKHLFFSNSFNEKNNILKLPVQDDLLKISYYDKIKNNTLLCKISDVLTIDCNNLSFPACCGLCHSIFNGGQFITENNKIIDIVSLDGVNGFFVQKYSNMNFTLDCYGCPNKYFCSKGCRAFQFENCAEPFLPIFNICNIQNIILQTLIEEYHKLGIFHFYFSQIEEEIEENKKYEFIKLLKNKGYPEYEFKYSK